MSLQYLLYLKLDRSEENVFQYSHILSIRCSDKIPGT